MPAQETSQSILWRCKASLAIRRIRGDRDRDRYDAYECKINGKRVIRITYAIIIPPKNRMNPMFTINGTILITLPRLPQYTGR